MRNELLFLTMLAVALGGCTGEPPVRSEILEPANRAEPAVRSEMLEPVNRAASGIIAATSVGVTFPKYSESVIALATELQIVWPKARTKEEREIMKEFEAAQVAYKDGVSVWNLKIKNGPILAPYHSAAVEELAQKYGVQKLSTGNYRADEILQGAWSKGREYTETAQRLLAASSVR